MKKIEKTNVDYIVHLTPLQEGMLFQYVLNPSDSTYHEQIGFEIKGEVDIEIIQDAWRIVVDQHDILRTVFVWDNLDKPGQVILKQINADIKFVNMAQERKDSFHLRNFIDEIMSDDRKEVFDLRQNAHRLGIYKLTNDSYFILLSFHHILFDGWSSGLLLNGLFNTYQELLEKHNIEPSLHHTYKEYIKYVSEHHKCDGVYWSEYFADCEFTQPFRINTNDNVDLGHKQLIYDYILDDVDMKRIREFTANYELTPADIIFTAWGLLLLKYGDINDTVFGITVSNRPPSLKGIEQLVGLCINTLPLRVRTNRNQTLLELLLSVKENRLNMLPHQSESLAEIQKQCCHHKEKIFSSLVVFENYPMEYNPKNPNFEILNMHIFESTEYDLVLQVQEGDKIAFRLQNKGSLYEICDLQRLSEHLTNIIKDIINYPNKLCEQVNVLSYEEKEKLLFEFNQTFLPYSDSTTLVSLFEDVINLYPDDLAVVYEQENVTYKQLNCMVNQFAHYLLDNNIKYNQTIAVAMSPSVEMLVALLAILKLGGICVPLDPSYPKQRNKQILSDCNAIACITDKDSIFDYAPIKMRIEYKNNANDLTRNPSAVISSQDIAFLLYTSGSTGNPKGTYLHHKGIINHIYMKEEHLRTNRNSLIANTFSINVVASIWQVFLPILTGSTLLIYPRDIEKDVYRLFEKINQDKVTIVQLIPSQLDVYLYLLEMGEKRINLPFLNVIALTSEAVTPSLANRFYSYYDIPLVNCYGQTECCDDTVHYEIPVCTDVKTVLIGKPSRNTRAYILDHHRELQPIGIAGELCIAGDGVTSGYKNNPEQSKEKFIQNMFEESGTLFCTGDLARWNENGEIECLGRIDHQLKIRGNRIEAGEIENALYLHPEITEAAVISVENQYGINDKQIHACYVSKSPIAQTDLKEFLKDILPDFCIPHKLIFLDKMPHTPNGKINKIALKAIDSTHEMKTNIVAPSSDIEKKLMRIWQELLNRDNIQVNENFFDAGGHSLMLLKLQNKIKNELTLELTLAELMQYTTINAMAKYITNGADNKLVSKSKDNTTETSNDIAIVGMSCRFPGADSIDEFWMNLLNGKDLVSTFENNNIDEEPNLIGKDGYVPRWGTIKDIDLFDAQFFNMSPREAELTDPQHRIFLMCLWEALEDAGFNGNSENKTGIFAAAGLGTYLINNILPNRFIADTLGAFQVGIGNDKDYIATKASYIFNLHGPSLDIQSACSSSLSAVHIACQSILSGECDMAVSGGAYIRVPQNRGYLYETKGNTSPDGYCRSFDAAAQGSVMGNGVGVIVLKKLQDAMEHNDNIYAIIKGSAMNNDGDRKLSYTAPSALGQAQAIVAAHNKSGTHPQDIGYIETHGTGTELGDIIEFSALNEVFNEKALKNSCAVGSVKANIGHLDVAAGIAGLIKTSLILKNKLIPPNPQFNLPNPSIEFISSPFYVNTEVESWKSSHKRLAGLSSFGIGGTNIHMIIEEPPQNLEAVSDNEGPFLLTLSAKTPSALIETGKNLKSFLLSQEKISLKNVAFTLQTGRYSFPYRKAFLCHSVKEADAELGKFIQDEVDQRKASNAVSDFSIIISGDNVIPFDEFFYQKYLTYKTSIDNLCKQYEELTGKDARDLFPAEQLDNNDIKTFILQYSLFDFLFQCGIIPRFISGVGIGKMIALCLSGNLTPACAMKILLNINTDAEKQLTQRTTYLSVDKNDIFTEEDDIYKELRSEQKISEILLLAESLTGRGDGLHLIFDNGIRIIEGRNIIPYSNNKCVEELIYFIIGQLWEKGSQIDWEVIYNQYPKEHRRISLPSYPFEKHSYWINPRINERSSGKANIPERHKHIEDWFYTPSWKQSQTNHYFINNIPKDEKGCILIFCDQGDIGNQISSKMNYQIIFVRKGSRFYISAENEYFINPFNHEDYYSLITEIQKEYTVTNILHLWLMDPFEIDLDAVDRFHLIQFSGFFSILFLIQNLTAIQEISDINMWIAGYKTCRVLPHDEIDADRATILGISKILTQEYSYISCQYIDFGTPSENEEWVQSVIQNLHIEMQMKSKDQTIAYRTDNRWIPCYNAVNYRLIPSGESHIHPNGVYLFVGGFGRIGKVLSSEVARLSNVTIIILTRVDLPDRDEWNHLEGKVKADVEHVKALESFGAKVHVIQADITNRDTVYNAIETIYSKCGSINGIFYLAGITGEEAVRAISDETLTHCQNQFAVKVHGLYNLIQALDNKTIDFCITVSSLCTIIGGLGSTTYASSNTFIDALAESLKDFPLISINWEAWQEERDKKWISLDKYAINDSEGTRILNEILHRKLIRRLIVSTADIEKRRDTWLTVPEKDEVEMNDSIIFHERNMDIASYMPPSNSVETKICDIWSNLFGIDKIGITDNFFEIGGHSLLATKLIARIRSTFRVDISLKDFFEKPYIKTLADMVIMKNKQ